MSTKLAESVEIICRELKDDPGYWMSWKANIAVQFQDCYDEDKTLHEISNTAAERFLELLTRNT